jgi:hypothetical protein
MPKAVPESRDQMRQGGLAGCTGQSDMTKLPKAPAASLVGACSEDCFAVPVVDRLAATLRHLGGGTRTGMWQWRRWATDR